MNDEEILKGLSGESTEPVKEEKSIYGVFSVEEVKRLHESYKKSLNIGGAMRAIGSAIFRRYDIRTLDSLLESDESGNLSLYDEVIAEFCAIQSMVLTKDKVVQKKVKHEAGDFKRDAKGNPIERADGKGYETYVKGCMELVDTVVEVPYYDYASNGYAYDAVKKYVQNLVVEPDFEELEKELCANLDWNRGLEIIRELTKYYEFDEPEKFVDRFALLICNAKAKGLNKQPKWPVMFSLVGRMGTGKSWLATMLKKTYDSTFHAASRKSSFRRLLSSQFNSVMLTRGFIHLDEKNGLDSSQAEELKTLITEPWVEVERKHRDTQNARNLVTFVSTTNESIKDVMGAQQDRRLVEFVLKDKHGEIPEGYMEELLNELWRVMPTEHRNPDAIVGELLESSKQVLDARMDEIVATLFAEHQTSFVEGYTINRTKLKEVMKSSFRSVRFQSVFDWCVNEGLFDANKNGHVYLRKKVLNRLVNRMEEVKGIDAESPAQIREIDVEEV